MSFDSPTPISLQSAKFQRLRNVFHWLLHFISWKFAVFLLPVYFIYCAKPEVDMAIHCRVIAFLLPICCVNLVTLTFDLDQLSYMARHVINTAKKLKDPTPIRSWVTSYNVFHWLLLKMRFRLLRMRRITWPVRWGVNFANILGIINTDLSINCETSVALR